MSLVIIEIESEQTPIPAVPVLMNGTPVVTDERGRIEQIVESDSAVRIESGLPAVRFDPIEQTGRYLERISPLDVSAVLLVSPLGAWAGQCEVLVGETRSVYLQYVNFSIDALEVPGGGMNYFEGNGAVLAESIFAPGQAGFTVPLNNFFNGKSYQGTWELLGQRVPLRFPLSVCTDTGLAGECELVNSRTFRPLRKFARESFENYKGHIQYVLNSHRYGREERQKIERWQKAFRDRGEGILGGIRAQIAKLHTPVFYCASPPPQCTEVLLHRPRLTKLFDRMVPRYVPREFSQLRGVAQRDRKTFARLLKRLPAVYQHCPRYQEKTIP
jgi:hypothetical protein